MLSPESQQLQAEDQYAIWSFSGGPDPFGTNAWLVGEALASTGNVNAQHFEILAPNGSTGQEFIIVTPEPRTLLLLAIGFILLLLVTWKKSVSLTA